MSMGNMSSVDKECDFDMNTDVFTQEPIRRTTHVHQSTEEDEEESHDSDRDVEHESDEELNKLFFTDNATAHVSEPASNSSSDSTCERAERILLNKARVIPKELLTMAIGIHMGLSHAVTDPIELEAKEREIGLFGLRKELALRMFVKLYGDSANKKNMNDTFHKHAKEFHDRFITKAISFQSVDLHTLKRVRTEDMVQELERRRLAATDASLSSV